MSGRTVAVILAAGSGERLGGDAPKAFVPIAGRPMVELAMESAAGSEAVDALVVAVPEGMQDVPATDAGRPVTVVAGGATRQESVLNSLRAAGDAEFVLVHDAARCLATSDLFTRVAKSLVAGEAHGVIPVVPVRDTIKRVRDGIVLGTVERDELFVAQTPQGFRTQVLRKVHEAAAEEGRTFTDDAGMLERSGYEVVVVEGEEANFKVTTLADLERARTLAEAHA